MLPLCWHQAMAMPPLAAMPDPSDRLVGEPTSNVAKPILRATGLSKQFHGFVVVNNANLSVREGSIHALIGPNGAGKTTMFNLLTGFLTPTQGKIEFDGANITNISAESVAQRGLVRSFQISSVFAKLSVHENVRVALQRQAGLAHQFWRSDSALRQLDERVEQLLDAVNLTQYRNTLATHLSYGRKRTLELATTLALEPKLLLLDEPMAGLAHEDIDRVAQLIQKVSRGRTVLMVEHNLSVVRSLCDAITVLQRGSVIAEGNYDEVADNPVVRQAYIGTEEEN